MHERYVPYDPTRLTEEQQEQNRQARYARLRNGEDAPQALRWPSLDMKDMKTEPLSPAQQRICTRLVKEAKTAIDNADIDQLKKLLGPASPILSRLKYNQTMYRFLWQQGNLAGDALFMFEAAKIIHAELKTKSERKLTREDYTNLRTSVKQTVDTISSNAINNVMHPLLRSIKEDVKKTLAIKAEKKEEKKSSSSNQPRRSSTESHEGQMVLRSDLQSYPISLTHAYREHWTSTLATQEFLARFKQLVDWNWDRLSIYENMQASLNAIQQTLDQISEKQKKLAKVAEAVEKKSIATWKEQFKKDEKKEAQKKEPVVETKEENNCIVYADLDDENFWFEDKFPLLHIAIQNYLNDKKCETPVVKAKQLQIVEFFMARQCSPYEKRDEGRDKYDAYESVKDDPLKPDWALLAATLRYLLVHSPAEEKIKEKLLAYCETSIQQLKDPNYNAVTKNTVRLPVTAELVKALYYAVQENFNDELLLKMLKTQRNKNHSYTQPSELYNLLNEIIQEIEAGKLVHLTTLPPVQEMKGIASGIQTSNNNSNVSLATSPFSTFASSTVPVLQEGQTGTSQSSSYLRHSYQSE